MAEDGFYSMFDPESAFVEPEERLLSQQRLSGERDEQSMRPTSWDEYFGQEKVKANLSVYIKAAMERGDALDHVLLYGPPGLGKTTLASIIASELGVRFKITTGPAIERQGDLAALLTNLQERDVLFIDEIHRLNKAVEEILYPAMEDFALDIVIGKGPAARSIRLDLPHFTLIGATTRAGLLTSPLRDRFGVVFRLELYSPEEIASILQRNAAVLQTHISEEALQLVSGRCRGTPRVAIRILRRLRDFAQVLGKPEIDLEVVGKGLEAMEIDALGLDATDLALLRKMAEQFDGGPVGLDTLAAVTGEDAGTIEDMYEPYLMQLGFLAKTPRGRVLTHSAYEHLGIPEPGDKAEHSGRGRQLPETDAGPSGEDPSKPADRQMAFDF